ncbi:tyrosine-type recombinase/integrase [Staphylococcus simulans]|uniref:tyrosine-type recombinase/integrase n=1 Tax=Staphylococcus simulans TaxID=1286 RepID=UPI000D1DBD27|nr:site-specific integrase [Staphylococcus simulans]
MKIDSIRPHHIVKFFDELIPRYSNSTMKNIKRQLSAILNYAKKFYDLPKNVAEMVELPKKEEHKQLKYWTLEQFKQFIAVVDNHMYKTIFLVLFWSGMRKGEVLALRYRDIDFDNNQITINNNWNGDSITSVKNSASERSICVPDIVIDSIKQHIKSEKNKYGYLKQNDYIFSAKSRVKPLSPTLINSKLKHYTASTDLPAIKVHYLRHSHASLLINRGVSLFIVSKHLGHSNIHTTADIYGHLYPSNEHEISSLLNNLARS